MDTESKRPRYPDSYKIKIEQTYYNPVTRRQCKYVGLEKGSEDSAYEYGKWVDTHDPETNTLLEQTVSALDLKKVIAAINDI